METLASADRKYVTLTLRLKISVLLGMKASLWASRPAGTNMSIQEPDLKTSTLQTMVTIPSGEFLLVGGMEDPGIETNPAPKLEPAGHLRGLFILVKPTILPKK